jgi:hypothetical protein
MFKICCLFETRDIPIQVPQPFVDVRVIVSYHLKVSLEVLHIHRIKTNDGRVEADVGLCKLLAQDISPYG